MKTDFLLTLPTISDPMATAMISNGNPTQNQPTKPPTHQPTKPPSTNQPSTNQAKKRGIIDPLPIGSCLEEVIPTQRDVLVPAVTGD
ncbi:hypothetical protein BJP36_23325 [Moorena producens JHB]|uniref:Uncharacterized protein n=1 Tax=Moorena producens (strain JHB) TaxID=1454205 RepID=A0A1D9G429_MOOP1|nr:hypothetical protein [Moorena producens]AOY82402.1 hypothetical protein BJP36_23325 [Moorena producens JHB]